MTILILSAVLAVIWLIGLVHLWQRQSRSREVVDVHYGDRMMAVFWLPLFLLALLVVPALTLWRRIGGRS